MTAARQEAIEDRMTEALRTVEAFFASIREEQALSRGVLESAVEAEQAVGLLREEWLRMLEDWRALADKVRELRVELRSLEEATGRLTAALGEEEWPAGA